MMPSACSTKAALEALLHVCLWLGGGGAAQWLLIFMYVTAPGPFRAAPCSDCMGMHDTHTHTQALLIGRKWQ